MRFVLVHGAWHTGEHWHEVAEALRHAGHEVYCPTVAGHGVGVRKDVNHAQCSQSIVDYIVDNDLRDFVLLGHSYGGTIISKVVESVADRVRRLVYWNAFVLKDGECLLDNVPYRHIFEDLAKSSADNTVLLPFDVWRESFINDADLDLAKSTYAGLSSEPFQPFADKLDLSKFYTLTTPRSYINCTEDIALPHGEWAWHPRMANRLGLCRVVQIQGSHEVMFTSPQRLAQAIIDAGRD